MVSRSGTGVPPVIRHGQDARATAEPNRANAGRWAVLALSFNLSLASASFAATASAKPNLLVIMTDEHNFRTLGCYRELMPPEQAFVWGRDVKVETPNIDWLAKHGAIADRFYATSPVCTPSRAAFVSGRYPQNTGAHINNLPMRDDVVTFAEVLRREGYATGYAGKWHLDNDARPGWQPPRKFGFEDNRYMFNRGHWKKLELTADGARVAAVGASGEPTYAVAGADARTFTTDFLADRAVEFIRAQKDKPFCYVLSIPDPHGPNAVRAPYDTMFDPSKFKQPHTATQPGQMLPSYASTVVEKFSQQQMALYFGMVKCIDDNVGKLLATLRATGVLERTFIVFTSDHGDMCGEHGRQNKGIPLEASARVPFLLHAPGVVKPGTQVKAALANVVFKPTILSLMGIKNPDAAEGRDASALFRGDVRDWRDIAFLRIGSGEEGGGRGWLGAFTRRHKLVVSTEGEAALFDLERDPDELNNLFGLAGQREIVRTLGRELSAYAKAHRDPHGEIPAVQRVLAWAAEGTGEFQPAAAAPVKAPDAAKRKRKR
ncbi:MAG: sulfatase [Opitutaceae bacterium]|nr:sulfatase [Opitutaceae bacterium]